MGRGPSASTALGESEAFLVDTIFGSIAACVFFLCVLKTNDMMSFSSRFKYDEPLRKVELLGTEAKTTNYVLND